MTWRLEVRQAQHQMDSEASAASHVTSYIRGGTSGSSTKLPDELW